MDEIKRKLALIDKQLAGRDFHARIVSTCPLVFVAVGLIAGILIQSRLALPVPIFLVLLGLLTAAAVFAFIIQQLSGIRCQYVTAYLALGCFACLGAIRLTNYHDPAINDIRNCVTDERKLATIRGRIVTEPYVNEYPGWKPNPDSPTLAVCRQVYERLFGEEPTVTAIHAGVECGLIGQRVGITDMVSLGPKILGAHSPDERVYVDSVQKSWKFLVCVLAELARG